MRFGADAKDPAQRTTGHFSARVGIPHARLQAMSAVVRHLCHRLSLPIPALTYDESNEINAGVIGSGPHDAVLFFSGGALRKLTPAEAAAVAAHELAHVFAGDFEEGIAGGFLGPGTTMPGFGWLVDNVRLLRWTMRKRRREYAADRLAAELVGERSLISALRKTARDTRHPRRPWLATHPHPRRRIRALEKLRRRRLRSHVLEQEPICR